MNIGGYVSFGALCFLIACLGVVILLRGRHSKVHRTFFFFTAAILTWMFSNFFENDPVVPEPLRIFLLEVDFAAALVSGFFFWVFSRNFPRKHPNQRTELYAFLPVIVFAILAFTPLVASRVTFPNDVLNFELGAAFPLYGAALFGYYAAGLWNLLKKFRRADGVERRQLAFVLGGFSVSVAIGLTMNLLLQNVVPLEVFRLGVYGIIFIVLGMGYAVVKHHLFDIKIIAAEVTAFLITAILFGQIFFSTGLSEAINRTALFLAVYVLMVAFVRSVILEVHRREDVQRLAEDLRLANTKLQELTEMKTNFISVASHQLRAPIGGVRGYLSMLRDGDFGELGKKIDDLLDLNIDTLNHLLHVIETFLNVTRIEAGKMDLNKEPVDMCAMTRGIYKELALTASRKKIRLVLSCPLKSATVRADKEKLRNVIFNLVENALKYTEHGTIKTIIDVGPKRVEMRVTDTGIGIAPKEAPQLFAKFVRAGGGLKISHGSGLGLYIVKMLIEAHGGDVFVESPGAGLGSTFGFRMPVGKARRGDGAAF
ncbi:sensor histidine kinase [Patescibacteria group bacterium]|nr:MAG: sensor histidine kinase [Patescibacteria group bacterium]